MNINKWTRVEAIIVFNLYCKIPFQCSNKNHPDVIEIAKLIGRSPSAVNMKIGNFGRFDENLKKQGIVGLKNGSKLDEEIWNEFNGKWDELAFESEKLIANLKGKNIEKEAEKVEILIGGEKTVTVKQRVNQAFFRQSVLSSYNGNCCITGISNKELLIASHIKPWKNSSDVEKTNPQNGLCLNALHDKAFDKGFITITPDFIIHISEDLRDIYDGEVIEKYFKAYENTKIIMPDKFVPLKEFLEYHNDVIFENWR